MNTVGEPYSGKPNVRIDEGRPGEAVPNRAAYSTANAHVTPKRVLPRQPQHQLPALGWQGWPPGTPAAAGSGPAPPDQRALPAQDRGRLHQEQGARRKLVAERGQDHAIGSPPTWAWSGRRRTSSSWRRTSNSRSRSAAGRLLMISRSINEKQHETGVAGVTNFKGGASAVPGASLSWSVRTASCGGPTRYKCRGSSL